MSKITPKQLYNLLTTDYPNTHYVEDLINSHFSSYQTFIQHYGDDADYAIETFLQEIINTHQNLHIIDKETAEILHTINLQNYAGEPLPPAFLSTNKMFGGDDMNTLRMEDVEKIEKMLADDKAVGIVWHEKNGGDRYFDIVDSVISGGRLVLRSGAIVYTGIDKLEEIREVA